VENGTTAEEGGASGMLVMPLRRGGASAAVSLQRFRLSRPRRTSDGL